MFDNDGTARTRCRICEDISNAHIDALVASASCGAIDNLISTAGALSMFRNGGWEAPLRNYLMAAVEEHDPRLIGFTEGSIRRARANGTRIDLVIRCVHCQCPILFIETKINVSTQKANVLAEQTEDGWAKLHGLSDGTAHVQKFLVHAVAQVSVAGGDVARHLFVTAHNSVVGNGYKSIGASAEYPESAHVVREIKSHQETIWHLDTPAARLPVVPMLCVPQAPISRGITLGAKVWAARMALTNSVFSLQFLTASGQVYAESVHHNGETLERIRKRGTTGQAQVRWRREP